MWRHITGCLRSETADVSACSASQWRTHSHRRAVGVLSVHDVFSPVSRHMHSATQIMWVEHEQSRSKSEWVGEERWAGVEKLAGAWAERGAGGHGVRTDRREGYIGYSSNSAHMYYFSNFVTLLITESIWSSDTIINPKGATMVVLPWSYNGKWTMPWTWLYHDWHGKALMQNVYVTFKKNVTTPK